MSYYRDVFLAESAEHLQAVTDGLLALESDPIDRQPIETVFRAIHSLKGMAAVMGYRRTEELAHRMESLMAAVRSGMEMPDHETVDLMLMATDRARELIEDEASGGESVPIDDLVGMLEERARRASSRRERESSDRGGLRLEPTGSSLADADLPEGVTFTVTVVLESGCVLKGVRAYMVIKRLGNLGTVLETHPSVRDIEDERFDRQFEVVLSTRASAEAVRDAVLSITEIEDVDVQRMAEPRTAAAARESLLAGSAARRPVSKLPEARTVRIAISHLDTIVDLVGELVIVRSRLAEIAQSSGEEELLEAVDSLRRVSAELHEEVVRTRMVPVGDIFNRFPRMVRDLARELGKDVTLELEGLDIELDRAVLDEITDPLVHLIRNAVDHGIEPPDERMSASKPSQGVIRLTAERAGDQVVISISDDGRGMDVDAIWARAVERGLADPRRRESYSELDILMFACVPAFTTVDTATRISGRGVGLDVVKEKVEALGGIMSLASVPGKGMRVSLHLPLTVAIIQVLLVRCGERLYALPLSTVDEVLSIDEVSVGTADGVPVVALRDGAIVAVTDLGALEANSAASPAEARYVVLLKSGEMLHALSVPDLLGRREIVVKPLPPVFAGISGLSGVTVLGDGRIALVLDLRTFFSQGGRHGPEVAH